MDHLAANFSTLSVAAEDIVVLVGLEGAREHNFQPARVVEPHQQNGRVGVVRLTGERKPLSVRRRNLLRASVPADRAALLTRIVWERQAELRVARNFLLDKFNGEEGLCLTVASFFAPRETMALTTGFENGRIVPQWSCVSLDGGRPRWRPMADARRMADVHGAETVRDGIGTRRPPRLAPRSPPAWQLTPPPTAHACARDRPDRLRRRRRRARPLRRRRRL